MSLLEPLATQHDPATLYPPRLHLLLFYHVLPHLLDDPSAQVLEQGLHLYEVLRRYFPRFQPSVAGEVLYFPHSHFAFLRPIELVSDQEDLLVLVSLFGQVIHDCVNGVE